MVLNKSHQTTIAISKENHLELSGLCKKGQSYDSLLTEILKRLKESNENNNGQSKSGVGRSATLAAKSSSQTAIGSDSNYEYRFR